MNRISEEQWGKDHWSLLAYVGTRCSDHQGVLDTRHLRIKNPALRQGWKPEFGTRLRDYWNTDKTTNPAMLLLNHDDYDCLDDLEDAGYIESWGTGLFPAYKITKKGLNAISALVAHKQSGKHYATFRAEVLCATN